MVALTSDDAGLHEVADQDCGAVVLLQLRLVLIQLPLGLFELGLLLLELQFDLVEPGHLRADRVLLLELGLLGVGDLGLGAPPLRACLEHVDAGTVEHYGGKGR